MRKRASEKKCRKLVSSVSREERKKKQFPAAHFQSIVLFEWRNFHLTFYLYLANDNSFSTNGISMNDKNPFEKPIEL